MRVTDMSVIHELIHQAVVEKYGHRWIPTRPMERVFGTWMGCWVRYLGGPSRVWDVERCSHEHRTEISALACASKHAKQLNKEKPL